MHGQGTFINPYGTFEGEFKNGFMDGKGLANYANGDKYSG